MQMQQFCCTLCRYGKHTCFYFVQAKPVIFSEMFPIWYHFWPVYPQLAYLLHVLLLFRIKQVTQYGVMQLYIVVMFGKEHHKMCVWIYSLACRNCVEHTYHTKTHMASMESAHKLQTAVKVLTTTIISNLDISQWVGMAYNTCKPMDSD
jgi:hypothetical protein